MLADYVWRGTIPVADRQPAVGAEPVVLIVTPDQGLRESAARVLRREGYRVVTAAHAGHATLACIRAGRVDLLATELTMEDMSGPALAARVRRQCPDVQTVYFAGLGTRECEGVLVRPFTRDDLLAALDRARTAAPAATSTAS